MAEVETAARDLNTADGDRERVERVTAEKIAAAPAGGPVPVMYGEEAERQLRAADRCTHQTGFGLPHLEYCGSPAWPDYGATNLEGLCARHGRETAGIWDPEIVVGDRVYDTDPDVDPDCLGTVTYVDNNGYRIRWDGHDTEYAADRGDVAPIDDQPPSAPHTVPVADGPASGETTGLSSAVTYTSDMARSASDGAASVETSIASLQSGEVSGAVLTHLATAQEHLTQAEAAFNAANAELVADTSVKEAYDARSGAGNKQFMQND